MSDEEQNDGVPDGRALGKAMGGLMGGMLNGLGDMMMMSQANGNQVPREDLPSFMSQVNPNGNQVPREGQPRRQANGNRIPRQGQHGFQRQANGYQGPDINPIPNLQDLLQGLDDDAHLSDDESEEEEEETENELVEKAIDALGNGGKATKGGDSVDSRKRLTRKAFPSLPFYHNICGCDPLNWKELAKTDEVFEFSEEKDVITLNKIDFAHYGFITDATINAWVAAGFRLSETEASVICDLRGNRYISDYGLHLLKDILVQNKDGSGNQKVYLILESCERVTEIGILSLLQSMRQSAENVINASKTSVSLLPKLEEFSQSNYKQAIISTTNCPMIYNGKGASQDKKTIGPYVRVHICPANDIDVSVGALLAEEKQTKYQGSRVYNIKSPSVFIAEAKLDCPHGALLFSAQPDYIIIPVKATDVDGSIQHVTAALGHLVLKNVPFSGMKITPKILVVDMGNEENLEWEKKLKDKTAEMFIEAGIIQKPEELDCYQIGDIPSFMDHLTISARIALKPLAAMGETGKIGSLISTKKYDSSKIKDQVLEDITTLVKESKDRGISSEMWCKETKIFKHLETLKSQKLLTFDQVVASCLSAGMKIDSAAIVEQHLKRMNHWGKLLQIKSSDPEIVITDVEWFLGTLRKLGEKPPHKEEHNIPYLHGDTCIWKDTDFLKLVQADVNKEKLQLLLSALIATKQLLLIQADRNDEQDCCYYLLPPQYLLEPRDVAIWQDYLKPQELNDGRTSVEITRKIIIAPFQNKKTSLTVWHSVLGEILRFCKPTLLHRGGLIWHQGAAEVIVSTDISEDSFTGIELRARSISVASTDFTVQDYVNHVFSIYDDLILYTLFNAGVIMDLEKKNPDIPRSSVLECTKHIWDQPHPTILNRRQKNANITVCTLCGNCSSKGMLCKYNGIVSDEHLQCLCEGLPTSCYGCGMCKSCAKRLWTYASYLRPNINCAQNFCIVEDLEGEYNQPHQSNKSMDPVIFNQVELFRPHAEQKWTLQGDLHAIKLLWQNETEKDSKYTFTLMDNPENTVDTLPEFNFSECNVGTKAWNNGIVSFPGEIMSKHPLTAANFFFEFEILEFPPEGTLTVGVAHFGRRLKDSISFDAQTRDVRRGAENYVGLGKKGKANVFCCGLTNEETFFSLNGDLVPWEENGDTAVLAKKQERLQIDQEQKLHAYIQANEGWKICLRPSPIWCAVYTDPENTIRIQENYLPVKDWYPIGKTPLEITCQDELMFTEESGEWRATVDIRYPSKGKQSDVYLFKVKVTHPKNYSVRPNSGVLLPGDKLSVQCKAEGTGGLQLDELDKRKHKVRIDVLKDVEKMSTRNYGTEQKNLNKENVIRAEKISAAWEANKTAQNDANRATMTIQYVRFEGKFDVKIFVNNRLANFKTRPKWMGQINMVEEGETPVGINWIPNSTLQEALIHPTHERKKTLLACLKVNGLPVFTGKIPCDNYHLSLEEFEEPPHAPPLVNLNQVGQLRDDYKVHALPYFMEQQLFRFIQAPRMPKKTISNTLQTGQIVYIDHKLCNDTELKFDIEYRFPSIKGSKAKSKGKGVKFQDEVVEETETSVKDDSIERTASALVYIPVTILKILEEGKSLQVKWSRENKHKAPDTVTLTVPTKDVHSAYWAHHMDTLEDKAKGETDVEGFKAWSHFGGGKCAWDKNHKSSIMTVDGNLATRGLVANSTDGVRLAVGFNTGRHLFKYTCNSAGGWGSFGQIGVCTANAAMHLDSYGVLLGSDANGYGWNIPTAALIHKSERLGLTKQMRDTTLYMELRFDVTPKYVRFYSDNDKEGFKAFEGMLEDKTLYPAAGLVYGGSKLRIEHLTVLSAPAIYTQTLEQVADKTAEYSYLPMEVFDPFTSQTTSKLSSQLKSQLGLFALTGNLKRCNLKDSIATVSLRQLQECAVGKLSEQWTFRKQIIMLPKQLTADTLLSPKIQHFTSPEALCAYAICDVEGQYCHLLNEAGIEFASPLSASSLISVGEVQFSLMCKLATGKAILPTVFDNIVAGNTHSTTQIQYALQRSLKLLLAFIMLNSSNAESTVPAFSDSQKEKDKQDSTADAQKNTKNGASSGHVAEPLLKDMPSANKCEGHIWVDEASSGEISKKSATTFDLSGVSLYGPCVKQLKIQILGDTKEIADNFQDVLPNLAHLEIRDGDTATLNKEKSLEKLPKNLSKLKYLKSFKVSSTKVKSLPEDLTSCLNLEVIEADGNEMEAIPNISSSANRLKVLSLESNNLQAIAANFGNLSTLEALNLSKNSLLNLPQEMAALSCLVRLDLSGKPFKTPQVLHKHPGFSLPSNPHETANQHYAQDFWSETRLGHDYVDGDEDGGIPACIFELTNLKVLRLRNQAIRFVPCQIARLVNLQVLDLSECYLLETLPGELGMLKHLRSIELKECPALRTPPREIVFRGTQAVKAYIQRLLGGTTENWRTKLMCVGLGGAGKTSLLKALMSNTHRTSGTTDAEVTDGIDIKTWNAANDEGKEISFSTWDFAGQDIYYNTHQFFLSGRAVYLLLWTCRLGYQHAGLDFWLSSIQCHAPHAPIFVIGTHVDVVPKAELPEEEFRAKYPQIKGFFLVSSLTGEKIAELKQSIIDETSQEHYMGEAVPTVYLNFEHRIISLRKSGDSIAKLSDIRNIAIECGICEQEEIQKALVFLHTLGTIQYFDNEFLRENVVINPQWIVDVMACVVSIKDSPIKAGRFEHEKDIQKVWSQFPAGLHQWLLRLTEEFDLTFPISPSTNVVPCLLPQSAPKYEWPQVAEDQRETMIIYKFSYLPAGLFNRSQVRLFQYSNSEVIWKNGSLLAKNEHKALIREVDHKELVVTVQGPRPENILLLVHEVIESLIQEFFYGVKYDYILPCPDCLTLQGKPSSLGMFDASLMRNATQLEIPFLQCRLNFHTISMSRLQASMPPEGTDEFDIHLANSMKSLDDLRNSLSFDVYIMVSKADLEANETKASHVHPNKIAQCIKAMGYRCHFKGFVTSEDLQGEGLQDSKLVVALISQSFIYDAQCIELFRHAKSSLKKMWQVVCIDAPKKWQDSQFGAMDIGPDHVFVNMSDIKRQDEKVKELENRIKFRLDEENSAARKCFISYAWANCHDAVGRDQNKRHDGLGWEGGDPRAVKKYLAEKGITCWLDVEQTGKNGLFEDIYHGIRDARVCVIFLSSQYAESRNCMMELRFAEVVLNKPLVAVIVGRGDEYKKTEMMALVMRANSVIINMQEPDDQAYEELLREVKRQIAISPEVAPKLTRVTSATEKLHKISYEEEFELAQRKFLRQLSALCDNDTRHYPRFIYIDFGEDETSANHPNHHHHQKRLSHSRPKSARPGLQRRNTSDQGEENVEPWMNESFNIHILCENDAGFHVSHNVIDLDPLPPNELKDLLKKSSAFLLRMYALIKHSDIKLNINNNAHGHEFRNFLNQSMDEANMDVGNSYKYLRNFVIDFDKNRLEESSTSEDKKLYEMMDLVKCYLATGQIRWLCDEHRKTQRVTVVSDVSLDQRAHIPNMELFEDRLAAILTNAPPQPSEKERRDTRKLKPMEKRTSGSPGRPQPRLTKRMSSFIDTPVSEPVHEPMAAKPRPSITKRASLLGSTERPVSSRTKQRMQTSGKAAGSTQGDSTSKMCSIM